MVSPGKMINRVPGNLRAVPCWWQRVDGKNRALIFQLPVVYNPGVQTEATAPGIQGTARKIP